MDISVHIKQSTTKNTGEIKMKEISSTEFFPFKFYINTNTKNNPTILHGLWSDCIASANVVGPRWVEFGGWTWERERGTNTRMKENTHIPNSIKVSLFNTLPHKTSIYVVLYVQLNLTHQPNSGLVNIQPSPTLLVMSSGGLDINSQYLKLYSIE